MAKMLETDILPYHEISEDLNTIVTSADVNGPASLSDSSIALMSSIFHIRNMKVPNASRSTCSQIIRWIFLRWNPGKYCHRHCWAAGEFH
jgi:ataxia telangiectasia mutated family protein